MQRLVCNKGQHFVCSTNCFFEFCCFLLPFQVDMCVNPRTIILLLYISFKQNERAEVERRKDHCRALFHCMNI